MREDSSGTFYYDQHVTQTKMAPPYKLGDTEETSDTAPAGESRKSVGDTDAKGKEKFSRFASAAAHVARYGGTAATAATIRAAARHTDRHPSESSKDAGNYRKGRFWWHGYEVSIENPKGSIRSGVARDGKAWRVKLPAHYGYLRRTKSEADGDHLDVFIGPNIDSELVFVIDQQASSFGTRKPLCCGGSWFALNRIRGISNALLSQSFPKSSGAE